MADIKNCEAASDDLLKREEIDPHKIKEGLPNPGHWDLYIEKGTGRLIAFPKDAKQTGSPGEDTGHVVKRGARH